MTARARIKPSLCEKCGLDTVTREGTEFLNSAIKGAKCIQRPFLYRNRCVFIDASITDTFITGLPGGARIPPVTRIGPPL